MSAIVFRKIAFISTLLSVSGCAKFTSNDGLQMESDDLNYEEVSNSSNFSLNSIKSFFSDNSDSEEDDHYGNGLCKDDVFAQYLKSKYSKKEIARIHKRYRTNYSRRKAKKKIHHRGSHYAREKLLGKNGSYYGSMPIVSNPEVEFWVHYFKTTGRSTFMKWLVRGASVKPVVEKVLIENGLPRELFYLAMVESGFSNTAYSRARATGTWQFMHGTAKLYDLKINHWVDERRDPAKASYAAAKFLTDLYVKFGDWYLAMAAYNAGPGKVRSAIRRAKTRDFWKISKTRYLPRETKSYVPKFLAATIIANNPKRHGFDFEVDENNTLPVSTVTIDRPVKIPELSRKIGLETKLIKKWNPELINSIIPPSKSGYKLRIHRNYIARIDAVKPDLAYLEIKDVLLHKIKKGDTLSRIARKYKVRIRQIRELNPKISSRSLRIGKRIAIPVPSISVKKV